MNLYTFKEFRTVLDTVSSVNDYNTYIQWESDIVPADSPFKDFNNKEDNTNIQHIALMLPSKDIVILISFEEEIANHSMYNSNTVFFNSMIDKIKDCVESLLWTNIEVKLELVCELYRAQIKVMKFLTNNKILILEDCLKSTRQCFESSSANNSRYNTMVKELLEQNKDLLESRSAKLKTCQLPRLKSRGL